MYYRSKRTLKYQSPLVVDNDLSGFIFGNVAVGPFMHEYDTGPETPSPWKGFRMFGQVVISAIFGTSYSKKFIAPVPLKLNIDDNHRPLQEYTMLGISTLADVGFYCKPFHAAVHHNDKLHILAMQCPPIYIILSVPKLWTARPTRKSYILDQIGETITMVTTHR